MKEPVKFKEQLFGRCSRNYSFHRPVVITVGAFIINAPRRFGYFLHCIFVSNTAAHPEALASAISFRTREAAITLSLSLPLFGKTIRFKNNGEPSGFLDYHWPLLKYMVWGVERKTLKVISRCKNCRIPGPWWIENEEGQRIGPIAMVFAEQ